MIKKWLIGWVLCCQCITLWAISTEQEQQFLYYFYAAHQAIENEQYSQALLLLDYCEQINPQDGLTKDYLGVIYDALHQPDKAMDYLRQAYACAPLDCWQRYCSKLLATQEGASQKKSFRVAQQILEQTVKSQPKDEDAWGLLQKAYIQLGLWKKALSTQDRLDGIAGYDAYSALNRYRIYHLWGKDKEALQAIDDYLKQDPREYRFLLFKGDLLVQNKQYLQAFILFAQIGDSLANIHELEGAYMAYDKALELDQNNAYVLNNYAYVLATNGGDLKHAEWMSQKTIQASPNNATYLDTYAWILYLQGQNYLAAFYAKKALENVTRPEDKAIIEEHLRIINEP